jgi:hypothetical protein
MTVISLEKRPRKIEAARSGGDAMFAAWGRTQEEAEQALARSRDWDRASE